VLYVEVTGAELVCLAVAQVLLRYDERHWLRAAPKLAGDFFPGCWGNRNTTSAPRPRRR
jgi:hypothetical protein